MTKTKKKQILIMTVVSLMIFTFLLWRILDKEEFTVLGSNETTPASSSNEMLITKDDVVEFINNYKLYQMLNYANDISELTNQNRLILATNYLIDQENMDYNTGVDASHYETYIHYVFGVDIEVENEDINFNGITIKYDEDKNQYIYSGNLTKIDVSNVLDKVTSYNNKKEEYTVTVKSIYMKNNQIYGSITDLTNNKNVLLSNVQTNLFEEKYYDDIEEKVQEVEYKLALEGKHLVLKDYKVVTEEE